ncbi:MAG: hypothetical protein WBP08_01485 [Saprospiraceae bacterium]|nr:hypothetical protein [Saprospiraceae bacterium]
MLKLGFGDRTKPKVFDYKPRYYDPAKEEMQERINKYKDSGNRVTDEENLKNRIRSGLRMKHYGDPSSRAKAVRQSNLRLVYIIAVLTLAVYIIMSSNKITGLLEAFTK